MSAPFAQAQVLITVNQQALAASLQQAQQAVQAAFASMNTGGGGSGGGGGGGGGMFNTAASFAYTASLGLVTTAIYGVSEAITHAINSAGAFEQALANANSVLQTSQEQMGQFSDLAMRLGRDTMFTSTQAAEGLQTLAQAGLSADQIMSALPASLDLAAASGMNVAQSARTAANTIKAFGIAAEDLGHVNDVMTLAFTNSNTNLEELSVAMKYAAPAAKLTGTSLEDLTAILSRMADAGFTACYDEKTECLTADGWKKWADIVAEDALATMNPDTNEIEYQVPTRLFMYQYDGKMYRVRTNHVDLLVTPNHRMWVSPNWFLRNRDGHHQPFSLVEAAQVMGKPYRYQTGGLQWSGSSPEYVKIAGYKKSWATGVGGCTTYVRTKADIAIPTELWAEFLGYYLSEGCCRFDGRNYRVTVTQRKKASRKTMLRCLRRMPFSLTQSGDNMTFCDKRLYLTLKEFGKSYRKYVPGYVKSWSAELIGIFIKAYTLGDGDAQNSIYTSSVRMKDDLQELALKIGCATTAQKRFKAGQRATLKDGREIVARHDGWVVHVRRSRLTPTSNPYAYKGAHGARSSGRRKFVRKDEMVDYSGIVYCAEVPNHLLIVRRNHRPVVCGNSMAGTAMRNAMQRLSAPTKEAAEILERLQIDYQTFGQAGGVSFLDVLAQIEDRVKSGEFGLGEATKIFGARGASQIMGALTAIDKAGQSGVKSMQALVDKMNDVNNVGLTHRIADQKLDTFQGAIKVLGSTIDNVFIQLGKGIITNLRPGLEYLTNAFNDLSKNEMIKSWGDKIGNILNNIIFLAATLVDEFDKLGGNDAISSILSVIEGMTSSWKNMWDTFTAAGKVAFEQLKEWASQFIDYIFDKAKSRADEEGGSIKKALLGEADKDEDFDQHWYGRTPKEKKPSHAYDEQGNDLGPVGPEFANAQKKGFVYSEQEAKAVGNSDLQNAKAVLAAQEEKNKTSQDDRNFALIYDKSMEKRAKDDDVRAKANLDAKISATRKDRAEYETAMGGTIGQQMKYTSEQILKEMNKTGSGNNIPEYLQKEIDALKGSGAGSPVAEAATENLQEFMRATDMRLALEQKKAATEEKDSGTKFGFSGLEEMSKKIQEGLSTDGDVMRDVRDITRDGNLQRDQANKTLTEIRDKIGPAAFAPGNNGD